MYGVELVWGTLETVQQHNKKPHAPTDLAQRLGRGSHLSGGQQWTVPMLSLSEQAWCLPLLQNFRFLQASNLSSLKKKKKKILYLWERNSLQKSCGCCRLESPSEVACHLSLDSFRGQRLSTVPRSTNGMRSPGSWEAVRAWGRARQV